MSNLSDLLPAGAGAKSATFTASGTLPSGQTVALNSDGTVSAAGILPQTLGSSAVFESAATSGASGENMSAVYDSVNDKVVVFYRDQGNSNYGTAVVGAISGTSLSFGTPVVYESATVDFVRAAFDSNAGKTTVAFRDGGNSNYGTAIVGTVSGTSISFGSAVVFESANVNIYAVSFNSADNKIVIAYIDYGNNAYGTAIVGTISGTSISFGSPTVFDSVNLYSPPGGAAYDVTNNKVVIAYRDASINSNWGAAIVGTVSGTSISFGSKAYFENGTISGSAGTIAVTYDLTASKVVVAYSDNGNSNYGTAAIGTVSGTSVSFGTPVVFEAGEAVKISAVYDSINNKVNIVYADNSNSSKGTLIAGTVSGTSISFETPVIFNDATTNGEISATFSILSNAVFISYADGGNSNYGTGIVFKNESTNSGDFVGITDQAIADTATGSVVVEGGVITNSALIAAYLSAGSETIFETATSNYTNATFDSTNNKVVAVYSDAGNSNYGTAVVGTVSGTSITFGTPVVFANVYALYMSAAFDSNTGKVVIAYADGASSNDGVAIVGTVSGTSISFGSPTTFDTGAIGAETAISYDSTAQKVVIGYRANPNYGTAIVGTVSGTSISFGSATVFESASTQNISMVYDPDQNKTIISYRDNGNSDYGTAIVGTVSGTSISFGTAVVFASAYSGSTSIAYDTNADKVVITYNDGGNSYYGTAIVGTVSGTSISFGTEVTFTSYRTDYNSAVYDVASGQIIISYKGTTPTEGFVIPGEVSGTSISFGTAVSYNPASTTAQKMVYDSSAEKSVVVYTDAGNSNYGTASVITASQDLTVGSTYYVQDDGSLSTTSSSVTAGKALSSTTLLLKG